MSGEQKVVEIHIGALLIDKRTGQTGFVVNEEGESIQLRPPAGGEGWEASAEDLRPADARERLHAKVAIANAHAQRRSLQ
ncbi:hypothetical protein [Streptomyces sp. NPDC101206]|uniref:hypothetical protein n=1 Tax=Streptomyces sp. NPDC101206 TaxID=3366128 RepID=UPI00381196E3